MEKQQQVIKLEVGHSLEGMWDDMGIYYLCSFECWNKLKLKDDLDFLLMEKKEMFERHLKTHKLKKGNRLKKGYGRSY